MFTKALFGLLCVALGYIGGMQAVGHAQFYGGAELGKSFQSGIGDHNPDYSACARASANQVSFAPTLFVGYRLKYAGIEAGAGKLFHSRFECECGLSSGHQDIKASQRYLRLSAYIPLGSGFELVPFVGRALVKHYNYEVANIDTHLATGLNNSTFVGLGVQYTLDQFFIRAEAQKMANVAEDPWSQRGWHNDVRTVSVGVGRYF